MKQQQSRREFVRMGVLAGAGIGLIGASRNPVRGSTIGANDRIRVGLIGCGTRNNYHLNCVHDASKSQGVQVIAACDIWRQRCDGLAKKIEDRFVEPARKYRDYRELLDNKDIDAVIIGSADHQHCVMLMDAVRAGKDVYIEKPIAMDLAELNETYRVVKASKSIVQHGTQGRSCAGAATARDFVQSGKLGKIVRIEESRSFYTPYWNNNRGPEKESETDWKAFLFNRPDRPFDSDQHGAWMGYRDFSTGTVGGWMSHFSDLLHYITGCGFPRYAVAHGGIFAPTTDRRRTCPDTLTAILEYPEGFTTSYCTHFGNGANDYVMYFGSKGVMRVGAPDGWPDGIAPKVSGEGSDNPDKIKEAVALENNLIEHHMVNWLNCIRSRKQPNADMEAGYKHGIAVLLADRAYVEGRKMQFDAEKKEIRPA